jgi:hypothetical protein
MPSIARLLLLVGAICCAATGIAGRPGPNPEPAANSVADAGRRALVLAAVGDYGRWPLWLTGAPCGGRIFDLAILLYGTDPFFTCPECAFVWHARGPKWRLIYQVLNSPAAWRQVR